MNGAPLSVLVVDDDFRVASVHVGFVQAVPGFRVAGQAHTAAEAIDLAESLRPDLVLIDIYLPDGDGLEVVRRLLADPAPPAVIVISAANDIPTVKLAVQLGALHYLVKPFGFAELSGRLTAFRKAHDDLAAFPAEATQQDVDRVFDLLRSPPGGQTEALRRLAPTLQAVYDAVAAGADSSSASEIAAAVGISRATAQRALTQLEQSDVLRLELRYGATGRPEHRYAVRRR
ncbi:response regulator [Leifsonia sp. fls2-241-R2A-40a]|uniref:response regulator n=1 Tax=Leifsonia sp. fls2-241-R2A-40a TaxID=3040290 RepID=UPI00254A2AC0|nr:response regulator [Leifsonia sp. fls2-241-R2A-40a]